MLISNDILELDKLFSSWIGNSIIDYKIVLLLNSRLEVHLLTSKKMDVSDFFNFQELKGMQKLVTLYQVNFEEEADKDWYAGEKIDYGLRRRLTNFIEVNDKNIKKPCPIITFYSYKGGTGRTTTLAFFASWLATHHKKKIVVIDCDFEAPGLTNYFDISEERSGVAEYLMDAEYAKLKGDKLDIKKDYSHQVRYEYVGKGDIYVIPAGNLSNKIIQESGSQTYRSEYFEALARIDITSGNHIIEQFESFFEDLKNQLNLTYENSIILIDSRTGFNDTFAVLSTLSDIIVGFFGINKQSQVGITQFLDNFGTIDNKRDKEILLVNSISENRNHEQVFAEIINDYISENEVKFIDEEFGKQDFASKLFRIPRREFLGKIGSFLENDDKGNLKLTDATSQDKLNLEFYEKTQDPDSEFKHFFNGLNDKISVFIDAHKESNIPEKTYTQIELVKEKTNELVIDNKFFFGIKNKVDVIVRRERVLKTLIQKDNFPESYADNDIPKLSDFYFRDCMKDLFNRDKFLIVGYKGTGKTHIYQSFRNREITDKLCTREKQNKDNYFFVNVIPVFYQKKDDQDALPDETSKYFNTNAKFSLNEIKDVGGDFFYERFWLAYIWNEIFSNSDIEAIDFQPSSSPIIINNDNDTATWFRKVIASNESISEMENDLKNLDSKLKDHDKILILSFDQLDFVVKPENWSTGVAPLITYWRNNIYSRIYPKIFVRADIFENRLGNITNINELQEKAISLQWSKQELFAYFFKFVFKVSKNDFFALAYAYSKYSELSKNTLIEIEKSLDNENQIPVSQDSQLRFLVENFFGKSAFRFGFRKNNFGDTYDWFFDNLYDAKRSISIRPFLDLIYKSVEMALSPKSLEAEKAHWQNSRILLAFFFASNEAKSYAAKRYFNDLAADQGNEPLLIFADFLKHRTTKSEDKRYEFVQIDFNNFLSRVMQKYPNDKRLEGIKHIDDFRHLLINNGIIKTEGQGTRTRYIIPFLYRSYFGVGNPTKKHA